LLSLTGCSTENSKELISNVLVERSRPNYKIFSLDYDPEKNLAKLNNTAEFFINKNKYQLNDNL